jgi:glutamate dehydrogenase (NADP+)
VAVTDSSGGRYSSYGLSAKQIDGFKKSGGKLADFKVGKPIGPDEIIAQPAEVLVLAALENAIDDKNVNDVSAKLLLELANGPVTYGAYRKLSERGIVDIPDILANSGGVIVSYLEWLQNKNGEHWPEDKVNRELENHLIRSTDKVYDRMNSEKMTFKEAAFAEAISKLVS